MGYFGSKQYDLAADVFDAVLQESAPARVTYYAALANQFAGRTSRAKALFQFVVTRFPDTTEAKYSQTVLSNGSLDKSTARSQNPSAGQGDPSSNPELDKLMEKTKSQLSPDMRATLGTPEGKSALREMTLAAMKNQQQPPVKGVQGPNLRRLVTSNSYKVPDNVSKLDDSFIQIAEKTQYSDATKGQILQALALIPENVKSLLFAGGTRIVIDSDSSNMGSDPGFDAAGMFVSKENAVHIAERSSTRVLVAYAREVILHEMGHAFDQGKSGSAAYLQAYQEECDKLNANDTKSLAYYVTTDFTGHPAGECFAELFKIICETGTPQSKSGGYSAKDRILERNFPKTMALIKTMLQ